MRREDTEQLAPPADIASFPLDWSELGGQIIAFARHLSELHVATREPEPCGSITAPAEDVRP
ncbi:MAG: hypothetical protein IID33_00050 [Planctomycetes bacterium]|nr:hypothetical protein [Planctomycetota bacterium]